MPPAGWVLLAALPPFVVLVWLLGNNLNSLVFGWWALARHYQHHGPFEGTHHRFRTCYLGWARYGHSVTVGANAEGLYLAVLLLLRPGHPPLFVPWADVTAEPVVNWLGRGHVVFRFAKAPSVRVRVSGSLGKQIAADANRSWADPGTGVE
jgi:hypothetical protein